MLSAERNKITFDGWILEPFCVDALAFDFNCDDGDLNDFFRNNLLDHENQFLTRSYLFSPEEATIKDGVPPIAVISFCNDALLKHSFKRSEWEKIVKDVPFPKRYRSIPAVKIARLGVHQEYQRKGVGTALLNLTKILFVTNNRTGCRFLTVDAYINERALGLYKKNHFDFITKEDANNQTRTLYFDLKRFDIDSGVIF